MLETVCLGQSKILYMLDQAIDRIAQILLMKLKYKLKFC